MADFSSANLISGVSPDRFSTTALTNQPIVVNFVRDMNPATFSDSTVALEVVGTVLRVPITYTYANRQLTIVPTAGLLPGTAYQLSLVGDQNPIGDAGTPKITGIKDILADGFIGIFSSQFTTTAQRAPGIVVLQLPVSQSAQVTQPIFSWQLIPADTFEIVVCTSNSFENPYWPLLADGLPAITTSTVTPGRAFDSNTEYWWRVRAILAGVPGNWSLPSNFYFGNPALGVVTPADRSLGFPAVPIPVTVYAAAPAPGSANLEVLPTQITVTLLGAVNLAALGPNTLTLTSEAVDGDWDAQSAVPIFSPALNGAMMGSGGIDYPMQVDRFQQITVSGALTGGVLTSTISGPYTTLTLTIPQPAPAVPAVPAIPATPDIPAVPAVPATPDIPATLGPPPTPDIPATPGSPGTPDIPATPGSPAIPAQPAVLQYFLPNNIYTVRLDLAELAVPLTWTFTTAYSPLFTSVRSVREWIDTLFINYPIADDEILYKIRTNSLYALMIQVYPPTQLDGESWIYDPPVSFDVNNPPYFVRRYVELKTAYDFLTKKFWLLIGAGGRTTLGDFTVDKSSQAIENQIKLAVDLLKAELLPYVDKLFGLSKRGYARGQWSVRGAGQYGGNNTPGGQLANDNSYLWPRSSRRQF